jgi:hypothetical protein
MATPENLLPAEQWPRCCRTAYDADAAAGVTPERPMDPSNRYVLCANCAAGTEGGNASPGAPPKTAPATVGLTNTSNPTVARR